MKNDEEIITLRNNIKKSAQAKVAEVPGKAYACYE